VQEGVAGALVHRAEQVAGGCERQLDRVVEAAATKTLDLGSVGATAPDARGKPFEHLALARLDLVAVAAVGPVQAALRPQEWPVDIATVTVESEVADKRLAAGRLAVLLLEAPQARVRGRVDDAVVPEDAGREGQLVGEDGAPVELAVAVGVFEQRDAAELLFQLQQLRAGQVGAGALGDEQSAAVVKSGEQGIAD